MNLEHVRNQAKDLLRELKAGRAAERLAAHHPGPRGPVRLADAQLIVAREHGFPSWPRLKAYAEREPLAQHAFEDRVDYYTERAAGLLASAKDGTAEALAMFERRSAPLTERGARDVVAAAHGFGSWASLRAHVGALAGSGEPFYRAFTAIQARDLDTLGALLERFPELVAATGTNGNDLLGLAAGTCDERLVALLIERGADVNRGNAHGWTPLHQAGYLGLPLMATMLLEAGASPRLSGRGDGGTPMIAALFWGYRWVAEVIAAQGIYPRNLRAAAGLDNVELIEELAGTPQAGAHRAFYRPHSGFPEWRPSDDPVEVLDEALSWASRNGCLRAIEALRARGADLDADVYAGSALVWAASTGRADAARRLLELGADPNRRGRFGGPQHGSGITALHLAAEGGRLDVLEVLLDAGADPTVRDALYDATPAGWAEYNDQPAAREILVSRGG